MEERKSILHELYVFSEWKPEPEYIQKPDSILPENISALWRWLKFFGPKKSLLDSIFAHKEKQQKWHIALGDEGKVIAVLADSILEIRTKRSDYATIAARTTVNRDSYPQWRKLVWSPDCSFVVLAYGTGVISFFDLTASNLFNIPADCTRPGGLECTDNTHAVADIIFMPLRVKDTRWNWEVLVVTFDGKLRGYLVSQTDGFKLHHTYKFPGGVASVKYCSAHSILYVAGIPRGSKDPTSAVSAGITGWRILNDDPFYTLSVVSDEMTAQLANERFQMYIPFVTDKNLAFIVQMELSPNGLMLACLHGNGDISIWRLPLLKLVHRFPLVAQPDHDLRNPLVKDEGNDKKDATVYYPADINWWSDEEIILSRFSGAVSICNIEDMINILGKKPEFFQGSPRVTCAHDGAFMALECESNILPAKKSRSDESMEVIKAEAHEEDSFLELSKELVKCVLYAITDMETFQPRPRRITVVSRVYRLLAVRSTTPNDLFSRKIESGNYSEALTLADKFNLDSDLVYQQQWRKNPVSTDAIQKYLSKVSKKIWAVHQCVDRLPETLPAAKELLQFGLELTNDEILKEINKDRSDEEIIGQDDITLEDLNAYTSELLRCRHVMLFYKERLKLYEAILKSEKSSYDKDEYDRLRSSSIVHSAMEIAKEGRIAALYCLWPQVKTVAMQMAVLEKLPETINPTDYHMLLPIKKRLKWFKEEQKMPQKIELEHANDWCRKEIFRSIWSSNWSEETTPDSETSELSMADDISKWYEKRAREIEERSGLVYYAVSLITLASEGGGVEGLDNILFHLTTLDTLVYEVNVEGVQLKQLEKMSTLETCWLLMKMSTPTSFLSDIQNYMIPYLKRYETLTNNIDMCHRGLVDFLESVCVDDLSPILIVLQATKEFELDSSTHIQLAEKCLLAYTGTEQLDKACDLLNALLKKTDDTINPNELVRRVSVLERLVAGSTWAAGRGVRAAPRDLRDIARDHARAHSMLTRVARELATGDEKPTQQDWEKLLKEMLEMQASLFHCVTKQQCYEIYASALLTSGDAPSIKLASEVLTCSRESRRGSHRVHYDRSVEIVSNAAKEYFNSASSLDDPALELARCALTLIKDGNPEIQQELDLISALQILKIFKISILPIQVRLCEDKMTLIEDCLKSEPNAYLASHKLLNLAKLLRIAGDDDQTREGLVLSAVCECALSAGGAGGAAAAAAARRLSALRWCGAGGGDGDAARLLARVAAQPLAHADRAARRDLYAAAATHAKADDIEDILKARLHLELEGLQQMGAALKDHHQLSERCPSTDDEFSDAITTPVIEKKDIITPAQAEKKLPLFNYLLDTFQNKFSSSDSKPSSTEPVDRSIHCQEFYRTLYPSHKVCSAYYGYDKFSLPENGPAPAAAVPHAVPHAVLQWYYIQNCLEDGVTCQLETEVVQKCAEEVLHRDSALSVALALRSVGEATSGATNGATRVLSLRRDTTALCIAFYAALLKCNAPELRDNVYLTKPVQLARTTLQNKNASSEQLDLIGECVECLSTVGEVQRLRALGLSVNALLYTADREYRHEIIYRLARGATLEHLELACTLARKYGADPLEAWLQHAAPHAHAPHLTHYRIPELNAQNYQRITESLWPELRGSQHNAMINYFTILKSIDEKLLTHGLTAGEHIKLLKKAKAASPELDYKLLVQQPSAEQFSQHMLDIMSAESVGMLGKFLRALPPAVKIPLSVNALYTMWLTKYFFSVPSCNATNKKWMQQYRQCASYFNKLTADDLLRFLTDVCFSDEAVQRVPSGTRILMLMQAVDYCQQEQENDKYNKNGELTWASVGQELTRYARFLENYYSAAVQAIIDNCDVPRAVLWPEIEKSHGDVDMLVGPISDLVMESDVKPSAVAALLQCLHVEMPPLRIIDYILDNRIRSVDDVQTLVSRLTYYHREGVKYPEEMIERAMQKASHYGLPPHKQIGLLSLGQRQPADGAEGGELGRVAAYSADLFRAEWAHSDYADKLTEELLNSEEGRREAFTTFLSEAESWQQKKALVDVLNCWPHTIGESKRSLHCEYLHSLLKNGDQKESLVLIKLLLRRPALTEEEVKWLAETVKGDSVINAVWIILLSNFEHSNEDIIRLLIQHKKSVERQEIEDELIKELLDNSMFIKLVPTPLYSAVVNYILRGSLDSAEETVYSVQWATNELTKANYLAEAGHLQLMTIGVPASLRGFSEAIIYCKNMFKN